MDLVLSVDEAKVKPLPGSVASLARVIELLEYSSDDEEILTRKKKGRRQNHHTTKEEHQQTRLKNYQRNSARLSWR